MTVLVTGAAGFIGYHTAKALLARGEQVIGLDSVNDYYDVKLKEARLAELLSAKNFTFVRADIADRGAIGELFKAHAGIDRIVHLAAQAGVRYSLSDPHVYTHSNVEGQLVMLEACRALPGLKHFVYASSSSVYGANTKLPFSVTDPVNEPVSLYAATKRAGELMAHCYSRLYKIKTTGLRFFTVYGPWGRPDMAAWIFARKILAGEPIEVFNRGDMRRDFTFIDDIVAGVLGCLDNPPAGDAVPAAIYNLGNHRSEKLTDFISLLESALGRKAEITLLPMQKGDVKETYADIDATQRAFGFEPKTPIS
ncbi:MAG: SDR family NAD(P)-dependent oxidoreductase, partial [Proteobacteria bacterium]|nr:SDR family NAD(P)-dependent oxidoreductase [Pseudomonadota bacterium]